MEHQKFGGPDYNPERMTWIKTNFMWMMFRCGWAKKSNQQRVLAIWLKREAFESYICNARTRGTVRDFKGTVRLQWDPDHLPYGDHHHARKAVQLGLKHVPTFTSGEDILQIEDVTPFVVQQRVFVLKKGYDKQLLAARERLYTPSKEAAKNLEIDKPKER